MWCSDFGKKNDNEGPLTSEDIKHIILAVTFQITFLCCFILTLVAILFDPIMCQSFMILLGFIVTVTVVSTICDSLMFCLFVNFYLLFGCCLAVTLIAHMNLSMLQPLMTSQWILSSRLSIALNYSSIIFWVLMNLQLLLKRWFVVTLVTLVLDPLMFGLLVFFQYLFPGCLVAKLVTIRENSFVFLLCMKVQWVHVCCFVVTLVTSILHIIMFWLFANLDCCFCIALQSHWSQALFIFCFDFWGISSNAFFCLGNDCFSC